MADAAASLGLSARQVRRVLAACRREGTAAQVVALAQTTYVGLVPARGIAPLDSSLDDQSQTCKDVETVTAAQNDPAEIFGKFTPRMVRMADEAGAIDDLAEASRTWRGYASGGVIHRTSPLY